VFNFVTKASTPSFVVSNAAVVVGKLPESVSPVT